jgi:hypothetical protein
MVADVESLPLSFFPHRNRLPVIWGGLFFPPFIRPPLFFAGWRLNPFNPDAGLQLAPAAAEAQDAPRRPIRTQGSRASGRLQVRRNSGRP